MDVDQAPRSVVIALDGSQHGKRGILQGRRLACALHLDLGVMTVNVASDPGERGVLNEVAGTERVDWLEVIDHSNVADGIRSVADQHDAIVCMATHGHGRSVALIGSIPDDVVRQSTLPVVLIGPAVDIYQRDQIERLVVAVSGTAADESLCTSAVACAREHGFRLLFVTVVQPTPEPADPATASDRWFGPQGDEHAYIAALVRRFESPGLDIAGSVIYDPISPAAGLAQMLRDQSDTLLVLGTHGRTGMSRLVHGSVASNIVAVVPVPVMMFPLPESEALS